MSLIFSREDALNNSNYRKEIITTKEAQVVLMSLKKDEFISLEVHPKTTQIITVVKGKLGINLSKGKRFSAYIILEGESVVIPSGYDHVVYNLDKRKTKIISIYTPPEHPKGTIEKRKPKTES